MPRGLRAVAALGAVAVGLTAACKGPAIPHPLTNEFRYTCCNLHYERPEISDVNYQRGTLIPLGTRVQILEVGRHSVKFEPAGQPPLTLVLKYGKDALSMDQYLDRIFLADDPWAGLRRLNAKMQQLITQGTVEPGMTRSQVIMALGYPPAHRTPSLEGATWTYWANRWATFQVYFDGDKVVRVER